MKDIHSQIVGHFDNAARRVRLQALVDQARDDSKLPPASVDELMASTLPLPESVSVIDAMIDDGTELELTDDEIIEQNAATFNLSPLEAVERLSAIDFAAARERYKVAA